MSINEQIVSRFGLPTEVGKTLSPTPTLSTILDHRSCRKYKSETIPEDLLQSLLASALSAPSKSDLQQVSVIHVADKAKQQRIANLVPYTAWAAHAPVFLVWCGDSRRIRRVAEMKDHPFANDHLDAFMNAAVDAGIAMQTFIIAAESAGLGCCPVSQIRDNIAPLSAELELPQWVFPVAGLAVGWPREESPISMRLPMSSTVHMDRYDDSDLLEEVQDYDQRRESVEQTSPENQRMVDEYGESPDYGWSENRTRQYSIPAREDFGAYIRKQGFDLS